MNPQGYFRRFSILLGLLSVGLLLIFVALESRHVPPRLLSGQRETNTYNGGLSPSVNAFVRQRKPVDVAVFADGASEVGRLVAAFFKPYQAISIDGQPAVRVRFIDPTRNPGLVRMNQIRINGEMILRLRDVASGAGEKPAVHLQALEPELFLNGWWQLERIVDGQNIPWVMIAQGAGARDIDSETPAGIGRWVNGLQRAGYRVLARPLDQAGEILDQVKLLILPAPVEEVPESILQAVLHRQTRLWWMTEPELADKQPALEITLELLGVAEQPLATSDGAQAEQSSVLGLASFQPHAMTQHMPAPVVMPGTLAFIPENDASAGKNKAAWEPLLNNAAGKAVVWFNGNQAVTGDTDFISNAYLNRGANRVFARRILDALLDQPHFIPEAGAERGRLLFTEKQLLVFSVLILFGVPLAFLLAAWWQWRRMRRI